MKKQNSFRFFPISVLKWTVRPAVAPMRIGAKAGAHFRANAWASGVPKEVPFGLLTLPGLPVGRTDLLRRLIPSGGHAVGDGLGFGHPVWPGIAARIDGQGQGKEDEHGDAGELHGCASSDPSLASLLHSQA